MPKMPGLAHQPNRHRKVVVTPSSRNLLLYGPSRAAAALSIGISIELVKLAYTPHMNIAIATSIRAYSDVVWPFSELRVGSLIAVTVHTCCAFFIPMNSVGFESFGQQRWPILGHFVAFRFRRWSQNDVSPPR